MPQTHSGTGMVESALTQKGRGLMRGHFMAPESIVASTATAQVLARCEELAHSRCTQKPIADQLRQQAASGWPEMVRVRVIDWCPWNLLVSLNEYGIGGLGYASENPMVVLRSFEESWDGHKRHAVESCTCCALLLLAVLSGAELLADSHDDQEALVLSDMSGDGL